MTQEIIDDATDAELGNAIRANYEASKKYDVSYIRWNVEDINLHIIKLRQSIQS